VQTVLQRTSLSSVMNNFSICCQLLFNSKMPFGNNVFIWRGNGAQNKPPSFKHFLELKKISYKRSQNSFDPHRRVSNSSVAFSLQKHFNWSMFTFIHLILSKKVICSVSLLHKVVIITLLSSSMARTGWPACQYPFGESTDRSKRFPGMLQQIRII